MKKVFEMFNRISEDPDKFRTFYEQYNKSIKLGVHEDSNYRNKLVPLLRFETTNSNGDLISLDDYVENMKPEQSSIYYITAESVKSIINSPFLEKLRSKNYEVVYMCDPLDEYILQNLTKYKEYKLINVSKDDLLLNDKKDDSEENKDLCKKIKDILDSKINNVIISDKIESQPAIVTNPMGMSANMERILKAQALATKNNNSMQNMMLSQRNLEINPEHVLIKKINDSENPEDLVNFIYESALLSGGYQVDDINTFLKKVYTFIN
jgi:molecular chaperone HtpG